MPKIRTDYGKFGSDRKHVERTQNTEKRPSEQGFFESLSGERVQVELTSGKQITGVLSADLYNRYDVLLETGEERYLLRKDCIEYVRHSPDKKEVKTK